MSIEPTVRRISAPDIRARKGGNPIVSLTSYHAHTAALLDKHCDVILVWPAFICVTAAYIRGNIARVLKHPMLVGVKLWAVAHLIANGDLGSIILFGSVLAWAVYDRISLKRRSDPGGPPIPYGGRSNDIIAVVVGTIIYLAFGLVLHPLWIGVPVFGSAEVVT